MQPRDTGVGFGSWCRISRYECIRRVCRREKRTRIESIGGVETCVDRTPCGGVCQESHSTAADNSPSSPLSTTNIPIPTTSTLHSTTPIRLDDTLSADSFSRLPSPRFHGCLPNSTLTRDYAIAVDRGRHSTRFLLFSRIPTSRVRTYSATAVSQGRVPVRDRGHDVVYCSRKRLSVSGTDERIREYSTERIRKAEWDI